MTITYGNLWNSSNGGNPVYIYKNTTTLVTSTQDIEDTATFSVLKDDIIEIKEIESVMAFYSVTFVRTRASNLAPYLTFTGTPPTTITIGGTWFTNYQRYYYENTADTTTSFVRYDLYDTTNGLLGAEYGIAFYIDTNNDLIFDVNYSVGGSLTPYSMTVNGVAYPSSAVVHAGDAIGLVEPSTGVIATFNVPSSLSALGVNADNGEWLKIDLGSAKKATSLNLESGTSNAIKDFKLYASLNNLTWTELFTQTNATISTTGTNFEFTNNYDYRYYGIVILKTNNNQNVSLRNMTVGVIENVASNPQCRAMGKIQVGIGSATAHGAISLSNQFGISSVSIEDFSARATSGHPSCGNLWGLSIPISTYRIKCVFNETQTSNYLVVTSKMKSQASDVIVDIVWQYPTTNIYDAFELEVRCYEHSTTQHDAFLIDFMVF